MIRNNFQDGNLRLKTAYEVELKKNKLMEEELNLEKDKDLWSTLRSRLSKGEQEENER
jgi:hypothetical protein